MSSVPYIFADDYGNIPLSYLDANFANVKANVDYANVAGSAFTAATAATVTTNAQPNITSVGTLSSLTVSGNTTVGNISSGNITTSGNITVIGTLTAGNIKYTSNVFVGDLKGSVYADDSTIMVDAIDSSISAATASFGNITATGNTSVGNISAGNITTSGNITVIGTLTAGNIKYTSNVFVGDLKGSVFADDSTIIVDAVDSSISAATASFGTITATGNTSVGNITASNRVINSGLEIVGVNTIDVLSNAATSNLSTSTTLNLVSSNAPGFTHTLNMPAGPVNGQLTKFSIVGNAVTLVEGTGTLNVGFAGNAAVGNSYVYLYRTSGNVWVKTA